MVKATVAPLLFHFGCQTERLSFPLLPIIFLFSVFYNLFTL